MRQCDRCEIFFADDEPYCPLCGPEYPLKEVEGSQKRSPYSQNPKIIRLRVKSLIVYDRHIFFIFSAVCLLVIAITLLVDLNSDFHLSWSRYAAVVILLFWLLIILPYAFSTFRSCHYLLLAALSISLFLSFVDLQQGSLNWAWIISLGLIIPALLNCLVFYIKRT